MKVWLVYKFKSVYPYDVLKNSIRIFKSYDAMFQYISNYYDSAFDQKEKAMCMEDGEYPDWETCKKAWIEDNDDEYIRWEERELE